MKAAPRTVGDTEDTCFTRDAYRRMLDAGIASGYRFAAFDDDVAELGPRVCLLRHDVDVDPGAARELAEIEHARGVRATYFVMLRSPLYNALGRANQTLFREIASLGHWIGLHYDLAFRPDDSPIEDWIEREAEVLATMLGTDVRVVSFHQPMQSTVPASEVRVERLVSAFDFPGFVYVSDANKGLREGSFIALFRDARIPRLHVCIHPIWWATDDPDADPMDLWDAAIVANLERSQAQVAATERAFGRARVVTLQRSLGD
jgi:hypothetical protein